MTPIQPQTYYNEFDAQKAAWLRELIAQGHIAPGDVDERSIHDVRPDDLRGYRQCHFFAGIGIWSYALRLAGWEDDREVWTGSCPCQPFSAAGKGEAFDDERHLWPELFRLFTARRPVVCFGEQVSSIDGLAWFDTVRGDLDDAAYTCGVLDTCAAGVGAPHRRQRLYWVADRERVGRGTRRGVDSIHVGNFSDPGSGDGRLADSDGGGLQGRRAESRGANGRRDLEDVRSALAEYRAAGRMADGPRGGCGIERDAALAGSCGHDDGGSIARQLGIAESARSQARIGSGVQPGADGGTCARSEQAGEAERMGNAQGSDRRLPILEWRSLQASAESERRGPVNGFWRDADWVLTRPQRVGDRPGLRPVERGAFPLAHGTTARVGRLRGYGDGIVAEQAAAFVRAYIGLGAGV